MRGKLILIKFNHAVDGITPAGAGKTANVAASALGTWDHPRRCGENNTRRSPCNRQMGSPPQVRGKHSSKNVSMLLMRITPAGAGKTFRIPLAVRPSKDHPRRCGENRCQRQPIIEYIGSPPQVRGQHRLNTFIRFTSRITPAGAGKTSTCSFVMSAASDHPRRCGENSGGTKK